MTKTELNEECVKHGTCKSCKFREWTDLREWGCSVNSENLEEEK